MTEPNRGSGRHTPALTNGEPTYAPHQIDAPGEGCELVEWIAASHGEVAELVREHSAVLLRGFIVGSAERFAQFVQVMEGDPLAYTQRSTRRLQEAAGVYTSTEYPPALSIGIHSENSFQSQWPQRIVFCSLVVAETGGMTPLADNAMVYEAIPPDVREEFLRRQIKYVRNFGGGLELSWQEAFQSEQRDDVERYCARHGITWSWKDGDRLMIEQTLPAAVMSRDGSQPLWFNQAHLFHVSNIAPEMRTALLQTMAEADLPRHAYFGDGVAIPDEHMESIRAAYDASAARFEWQVDDVLLLDNLHVAHGRDPFTGDRKVLVAMSDPLSFSDCQIVDRRL
jgi:alpha-ketoglutarate-dependent taurine dioxygenase